MADEWQQLKEIFHAALSRTADERKAFLDVACRNDAALRNEVESLLASYNDDNFLEEPAVGEVADVVASGNLRLANGAALGHYRIISELGTGGMGEVYLAEDTLLERRVAIKLLNHISDKNPDHLRRFFQEARAASALNHPNILTIYEIGEVADTNYIATELVQGRTLRKIITDDSFGLSEVLDISIQLANALHAAHAARIVHRDIKPENIMIRDDGLVKILDFGLAKLVAEKVAEADREAPTRLHVNTEAGLIMGTVKYMSPEQTRGKPVDARTDIWSLGIVIYEMLVGRVPFVGETTSDVIAAILKIEPEPIASYMAEVPPELDYIIGKTLGKDPEERYQNIKDLLVDLRELEQKIDFQTKMERTGGASRRVRTIAGKVASVTGDQDLRTRSSAEFIVSEVRQHKRGLVATAAVLLLGAIGYALFLPDGTPEAPPIESIAVLPLRSLDATENYLGLGIADAIIRRMSQTGKLIVRPTSAVRRYLKEETDALAAARQLEVDAVIDGTVQRSDDRLRVSINLLRVRDGVSLWADSFEMRASDIFTIQDTIAQQVTSRLRLRLNPAQQQGLAKRETSNALAYEYYVKGVYSFDQRGFGISAKPQMEATIELFKKANEADPNYALSHATLAYAYAWTSLFIDPLEPAWTERAREEIARAQALDSELAEVHLARHLILWGSAGGHQTEAAIRELLVAQKLNPNIGHAELAHLYGHLGLEDLAARSYQRALEIDPTSEAIKRSILNDYFIVNKYDDWLDANQKFFNGKPNSWYFLGKNRLDEAQAQLDELLLKEPDSSWGHSMKGILYALKGNFRAAEAEVPIILSKQPVQELPYHHITYDIACLYALTENSAESVKWLRETAAKGFPSYPLFAREPYLNRIRQSPEFVEFMAEMKERFERYKREFEPLL